MKDLKGTIVALQTPLTARVSVVRQWQHPVYGKSVKRTKTYACHIDAKQSFAVGDEVFISPCRPMSKTKRFMISKKVVETS